MYDSDFWSWGASGLRKRRDGHGNKLKKAAFQKVSCLQVPRPDIVSPAAALHRMWDQSHEAFAHTG